MRQSKFGLCWHAPIIMADGYGRQSCLHVQLAVQVVQQRTHGIEDEHRLWFVEKVFVRMRHAAPVS